MALDLAQSWAWKGRQAMEQDGQFYRLLEYDNYVLAFHHANRALDLLDQLADRT